MACAKWIRETPGVPHLITNTTHTGSARPSSSACFALALVTPLGAALYVVTAVLYGFVFSILLLVEAFRRSILAGVLCLLVPFYSLYFWLVRCESPMIKLHVGLSFLANLGIFAMVPLLPEAFPEPPG